MTRLEQERRKRKWSQTTLAAAAGKLSGSDISRIERRWQKPYPAQAERLAKVLDLDPEDLTRVAK